MSTEGVKRKCPVCNSDESIQRLSAIVSSGTVSGTFSGPSSGVMHSGDEVGTYGGYTTLSGTSMSNLARVISLQDEPKLPAVYNPIFFYVLLVVQIVVGLVTFGVGLVLFILSWLVVASMGPIVIGDYKKEYALFAKRYAEWKLEKEYWLSLYYCHKDGVVFNPLDNEHCQPEETKVFVYKHIPQIPIERFENTYGLMKKEFGREKMRAAALRLVDDILLDIKRNS